MATGPRFSRPALRPATATRLAVIAVPIYFVWEMAQAPLFTGMPRDWRLATLFCALATIGDVVLLLAFVALGSVLFGDERWFTPPHVRRYAVITLVGLAAQIAIEWLAVEKFRLWGYQPWHPRLPLVGTGLVAALQPLVVVPSVLSLVARWVTRVPWSRRRASHITR